MPRQHRQLPLFDFTSICPLCVGATFKFRDVVKKINAKHPQRGSVLMNAIVSDKEWAAHEAWVDQQKEDYMDPKLIEEHEAKR